MSTLKVNTIRHTGASSDAVTLATDGTCTAKITNNLSNRNLIINGAMQVAQRGTSSTTSNSYVCDRFNVSYNGQDEAPTFEQADIASGTTPYNLGFRKCLKVTNGNQTSGAGTSDYIQLKYVPEAQDIATSGWNYTSASSYVTLSFWIKSSVAQEFTGSIWTADGTAKTYKFSTPSLSANTWTKVTKTIPGHADLTFDNNNGVGLNLYLYPFIGTGYTTSVANTETWIGSGVYANDVTSTWWTTNDATFEITGVQLEVGDVATDFEHRSYGDELRRCMRYYWQNLDNTYLFQYGANHKRIEIYFPVPMRATPTYDHTGNNITIDSGSHQNEGFFCAYSASDYDGPGRNYSNVKFDAEL